MKHTLRYWFNEHVEFCKEGTERLNTHRDENHNINAIKKGKDIPVTGRGGP
jgi:hypothetical protein